MSKWDGLVSPRRAATIIGVHEKTIYRWCRAAEAGHPTRLARVERDEDNGYFRLSLHDIAPVTRARSKK